MKSRTTRRFRDALAALPAEVQQHARQAYRLFLRDPAHPGLQFRRVHTTEPVYSARIGLGYRAVGALRREAVVWFWVGSHADYDKLLARL